MSDEQNGSAAWPVADAALSKTPFRSLKNSFLTSCVAQEILDITQQASTYSPPSLGLWLFCGHLLDKILTFS